MIRTKPKQCWDEIPDVVAFDLLPAQDDKIFGSPHHESHELVAQQLLDLVGLLDRDGHADGVDARLDLSKKEMKNMDFESFNYKSLKASSSNQVETTLDRKTIFKYSKFLRVRTAQRLALTLITQRPRVRFSSLEIYRERCC